MHCLNARVRPSRSKAVGVFVVAALVSVALVTGGAAQAASADETPTPDASTSAAPTDSPNSNPSLEAQNDAHDHVLGATQQPSVASSPSHSAKSLALPQAAAASRVLGMDVSGYQPNVDWNVAKTNGAKFVYIKATESYTSKNDSFQSQWQGATNAGLIRGAYHFADPYESQHGATEANWFLDNGGTWTPDGKTLPPVLDMEKNPYLKYGTTVVNTCYNMTPGQLASWIADFSSTVLARTGIRPTIYTNPDFWQTCMSGNPNFSANPLFVANWTYDVTTGPGTLPASWSRYAFWQYADDKGTPLFPGDQDVFNGDLAALTTFAANATPDSNYLNALYHDYLDRSPAPTELADWETRLASGTPIGAVAEGFVDSDEYRRIRINAAYETVLGRAGEPSGVQTALDAMHAGTITTDDIETAFYASDEYYNNHGGTDTRFVASLYTQLLHRSGADSEVASWVGRLPTLARPGVISQFWDANETVTARVDAMYKFYLGRTPDAPGLKSWVALALQIGDSGLREGFTGSAEYYSRSQTRAF